MSKAFVIGHGAAKLVFGTTVVPPGREVHFYANVGEALPVDISTAVLNAADAVPVQVYREGEEIPNYVLAPDRPGRDTMAVVMAATNARLGGEVYVVGHKPLEARERDERLPASYRPAPGRLLLCTGGLHCGSAAHHPECAGLFARLKEKELHLLICRIADPTNFVSTETLRTRSTPGMPGQDFTEQMRILRKHVWVHAQRDPYGALNFVESLPVGTLSALRSGVQISCWLKLMYSHPLPGGDTSHAERVLRESANKTGMAFEQYAAPMLDRLPPAAADTLARALSVRGMKRKRPDANGPADRFGSFRECWADMEARTQLQEWLAVARNGDTRQFRMAPTWCQLYEQTGIMLGALQRDEPPAPSVVDRLIDDLQQMAGPAGVDPVFLRKAEALRDLAGVDHTSEEPGSAWQRWDPAQQIMFTYTVTCMIGNLQRDLVRLLDAVYQDFRSSTNPVKRARTSDATPEVTPAGDPVGKGKERL